MKNSKCGNRYKHILTKEFLEQKITIEQISRTKLAELVGCSLPCITNYCKKFDIKYTNHTIKYDGILTKEFLEQKLITEGMSQKALSIELGCSTDAIADYLKRYGLLSLLQDNQKIKIDVSGQRFGKWLVSNVSKRGGNGNRFWECRCDCGKIQYVNIYTLLAGKSNSCKKCALFGGYQDISGTYFNKAKANAKFRNLVFDITIEYVWELFLKQNKKCALSGIEIRFHRTGKEYEEQTASIDRIDSKIGYVKGNIQIIHKRLQNIKKDSVDEELIAWCDSIHEYHKDDPKNENIDLTKGWKYFQNRAWQEKSN